MGISFSFVYIKYTMRLHMFIIDNALLVDKSMGFGLQ